MKTKQNCDEPKYKMKTLNLKNRNHIISKNRNVNEAVVTI